MPGAILGIGGSGSGTQTLPDGTELPGSAVRLYKETRRSADLAGSYATAAWLVDYRDVDAFQLAVGGRARPTGWGWRIVPMRFPDSQLINMYACAIRYDALGFDVVNDTYAKAKVEVDFKTFTYDFEGDLAFITERYQTAAEIITRPGSAYHFPSDSRKVNQEVGVLVPGTEFALTFHQMQSLNFPLYESLEGRVNSATFVPDYYNIAPGHIQFLGADAGVQTTVGGSRSYEATFKFRYRWIEINSIMRGDGTGFEAPVDGAGNTIYPTADLNLLFS